MVTGDWLFPEWETTEEVVMWFHKKKVPAVDPDAIPEGSL